MIVPKRFELYGSTSYVFGQYAHHPHEFIVGSNYYPWNTPFRGHCGPAKPQSNSFASNIMTANGGRRTVIRWR